MLSYNFKQDPEVANKAVFYLRYSSENQTENSIEGQRRECEEFAKKHNIDILGEYVDRAKTGTNDNRPDFQRMIHDSYKKVFGNVIVWKYDRFSRDRLDSLKYRRELFSNGVKVLSVTEPNIDGPMGTLFDSMNDGMNQLYSEELSVKVKRGQNENVINGKSLGGYRPIGYNIVDGRFVIDEKEGRR
jgi:DNA invertase Pin-like site-specific DNA recombinase